MGGGGGESASKIMLGVTSVYSVLAKVTVLLLGEPEVIFFRREVLAVSLPVALGSDVGSLLALVDDGAALEGVDGFTFSVDLKLTEQVVPAPPAPSPYRSTTRLLVL